MSLILLVFRAFHNSWSHTSQVQFSHEAKMTLSKEDISPEKLTFFNNYTNVFHLRLEDEKNNQIVSNIQIQKNVYYGGKQKYDVFEIYSVYTTKKYRKMGMAKQMIFKSIEKARQIYNVKQPVLVLHLNTEDAMMHVAFSFYINLGFHTASYVPEAPSDLKFCMDDRTKFFSWDEVLSRPVTNRYLTLFAFNGFNNEVKGDFTEMGTKIRQKVLEWIDKNKEVSEEDYSSSN